MILSNMPKEKIANFIDKCAFSLFLILAFFLPISNATIEISFCLIYLCFLIRIVLEKPTSNNIRKFFKNRINLSLLVFFIFIGLSLFKSGPLIKKSFIAWIFKWGEGFLLFYFAQTFLKQKHVKILLAILILSTLLICIDGIYQQIKGVDFINGYKSIKINGLFGVRATFPHYNDFGAFLTVMFFVCAGFLKEIKNNKIKALLFLIILFIVANIFLTYSRGTWVTFLIISLLAVFFSERNYKIFCLVFLIFFILTLTNIYLTKERFLLIFKEGGDTGRLGVWKMAIDMAKDSPFLGKGIGLFMDYFSRNPTSCSGYQSYYQYTHNCYLQILAETGLLGLLPFLWFLGELLFGIYNRMKKKIDYIITGLFWGFLAFLFHSFFDTHLYSLKLSILFWLLASFLAIYVIKDSRCGLANSGDS